MNRRTRCGECGVEGSIFGVPSGVVPAVIACGNCNRVSAYRASRYDLIGQDYDIDVPAPFYLSPDWRTAIALACPKCGKKHHNGKPVNGDDSFRCLSCGDTWSQTSAPPDRRQQWLKKANTRQVLSLLDTTRAYGPSQYDAFSFTAEELKAELAVREHVPNKKEGKALRRARSQGKSV